MAVTRLVLDTNVWLDWLVFDDPQIAPLRSAHGAGEIELCTDAACTEELRRVLGYTLRKEVLSEAMQAQALAHAISLVKTVAAPEAGAVLPPLPLCRDGDDQKFLELARAAKAHYLLTKDRALLELSRRKYAYIGFRILTPSAYFAELAARSA